MNRKEIIFFMFLFLQFFVFPGYSFGDKIDVSPQKIILDSGFYFIYDKNENSKNTALQMAFYGGNNMDPIELKGISQLASRMFIQITGTDKIKTIVSKNSIFYIRVKGDYVIITIECISEYFDEAAKIFFKTIGKPDITGLRLNYMKKRFEQMQKSVKEDYNSVLNETIMESLFKGSGYEGSIYGDSGSLKNIKRKSISAYHNETINLSNMVISISTDLSVKIVSKILKKNLKYFSEGNRKDRKEFIPGKIKTAEIRKDLKGDLYTIAYAFPLWFSENKLNRKDFIYGKMIENYLGKGIGSYLWSLRTEENLTYSINSKAVFFKPFGYLYFFIKTEKKNRDRSLGLFKTLTNSLYESGVNKTTLDSIISYTSASFQRQNELKRALSYNLTFFEILGLGFDFYREFYTEIKEVTVAEFNNYLKKTLKPSNRLPIILGDINLN